MNRPPAALNLIVIVTSVYMYTQTNMVSPVSIVKTLSENESLPKTHDLDIPKSDNLTDDDSDSTDSDDSDSSTTACEDVKSDGESQFSDESRKKLRSMYMFLKEFNDNYKPPGSGT